LGFASAALQLRDRDRWLGWDLATRRAQLDRIVGLSRFLIRPSVRCRNLASQVLGMALRRLAEDFEASCFAGTCFQAANWIRVGQTQGRGRQDAQRRRLEPVKDIYLYPLVTDRSWFRG
jgi:hypothetical protein